jgi:hypothetical protein
MKRLYNLVIILIVLGSCTEDKIGQIPTDNTPPKPLSNVQVEPLPGGGKITYTLPDEMDISYVKGEYFSQGKKWVVRSSIYSNYLVVEGLGSTDPVEITLSVVDHSENVSEPVKKSFTPDTPPIETIFSTLHLEEDFAGIHVTWDNNAGLEIGITLYSSDSLGAMKAGATVFSKLSNGSYTFRGYPSEERKFAVSITDKWGNSPGLTDEVTLTPYFERLLDRTKHGQLILPLDNTTTYSSSTPFSRMFDGLIPGDGNFWHTQEGNNSIKMPIFFTVNLGVTATLSRFVVWHRFNGSWEYKLHNIKAFEVWGAATYKASMPNDYWEETWKNDWVFIGDFITPKPSGIDNPSITAEDKEFTAKGFEFPVPLEVGKVQYLRFVAKSTWGNTNALSIQELQFYGNDNN